MSDEVKRGQVRREQGNNKKIDELYHHENSWGENALDTEHRNVSKSPKAE